MPLEINSNCPLMEKCMSDPGACMQFLSLTASPAGTADCSSAAAAAGCRSVVWALEFDCSFDCILGTDCSCHSCTLGYSCSGCTAGCSFDYKTEAIEKRENNMQAITTSTAGFLK